MEKLVIARPRIILAAVLLVAQSTAAVAAESVARGGLPDLTVDSRGGVHLVYVRDGMLFHRERAVPTGKWSEEQNTGLKAGLAHRSDPEVVTDSRNRPHVLVGSGYAWRDGTKWIATPMEIVRDTAMAIDSKDNVYVIRRRGHQGGHIGLFVRSAGSTSFEPLPDPDIADGLPIGRNDHVYGHVFVGRDDSLFVVYRHAAPDRCSFRVSTDGGRTWKGGGVNNDDAEAPSGALGGDRRTYVVTGLGNAFRWRDADLRWEPLGRAIEAEGRELPIVTADASGNVFVSGFGGDINVGVGGKWIGRKVLPSVSGKSIGFVDLARTKDGKFVYAAWEEGDGVAITDDSAGAVGEFDLCFSKVDPALEFRDDAPVADEESGGKRRAARAEAEVVSARAPLWGRFEAALENRTPCSDPYRDVSLEVTATRPDGKELKLDGFYDGEFTWRFRVLMDQVGEWRYSAAFSDGSRSAAGTFQCIPSDSPGPVDRDETNPIWFGYRGNGHGLVRGFHVGDRFFAENWPDRERRAFLDWAQGQGYNLLSIASHFVNRQEPKRGAGWRTPDLWPLNAAEYRRTEAILDDLARRRMIVFPFAGFFGQNSDYPRDPRDQQLYIRYTIARFGTYPNLMWNVAGPEPAAGNWMSETDVRRLGELIDRLDPYDRLLSVHNKTGRDTYRDADWTTYGIVQGPKTIDRELLSRDLLGWRHPQKPLLAQETLWSGNINHIGRIGRDYTNDDLRKNAWVINMSAAALVFADNGGGKSSDGFSGTLDLSSRDQPRHDAIRAPWDYLESIPFHRLSPRQDLVDRGYCLAEPGRCYLVYIDSPGSVHVKLEGGPYEAVWVDGSNPKERRRAGPASDGVNLASPTDGDDWLLELTRVAP
ncbi:Putative endoglucanase [Caulifigura coniformis]|uniref:Endoglucanase n=1 Tax=Caulifigura coniformis TaxID=2527983 RepID=A0A517SIF5_9PLAN|nr:DUF5060 domain-containing protein [Caulifigura coniformis]QDT55887.1 Putative endoglucanase [Caulifigura coniformis]